MKVLDHSTESHISKVKWFNDLPLNSKYVWQLRLLSFIICFNKFGTLCGKLD